MNVTKDMLDLARHIVEQKAVEFDPAKFEDRYEAALVDLVNRKRHDQQITPVASLARAPMLLTL